MFRCLLAAAICFMAASTCLAVGTIQMVPQSDLLQGISVSAVSAKGQYLIGPSDGPPFRWRIGSPSWEYIAPAGSTATGISGDGDIVVGLSQPANQAFRW